MFVSATSPILLCMYNFVLKYFLISYDVAFLLARVAALLVCAHGNNNCTPAILTIPKNI